MSTNEWIVNSDYSKQVFLDHMSKMYDEHKYLRVSIKTGKQRSGQQNKALHVYVKQLADALNDGGFDMDYVFNEGVDIPWNEYMVKEFLWKPVMKAVTGKNSTTQPKREQYTEIYEIINRKIAEKCGFSIAWPRKKDK